MQELSHLPSKTWVPSGAREVEELQEMAKDSIKNQKAAARAEGYLRAVPSHLLGPAGRVLLSNAPSPPGNTAAGLRGIAGRGGERRSPSQRSLIVGVDSE